MQVHRRLCTSLLTIDVQIVPLLDSTTDCIAIDPTRSCKVGMKTLCEGNPSAMWNGYVNRRRKMPFPSGDVEQPSDHTDVLQQSRTDPRALHHPARHAAAYYPCC